jgi:hypothetical protein
MKAKNRRIEPSPELEALIYAVSSLREAAGNIEGNGIYTVGDVSLKWDLTPPELKRQQARAAAMRTLANRLELQALVKSWCDRATESKRG